jgi:hypothetical protein
MSKKWRLTERTKTLLTLELAIVLPAAALMGFSIWNLTHIQRDKSVEAAIQRDFQHVLKIAERKSWHQANDLITPVRKEFPNPDDGSQIKAKLENILRDHPEYAFAALYDKKNNQLVSRVQPGRDQDMAFCGFMEEDIKMLASWMPTEASSMAKRLRNEKEEEPWGFYGGWALRGNQHTYWNVAYFIPKGVPPDRVALGFVAFDDDYLRKSFFPALVKDVLSSKSTVLRADANLPVMMIHAPKDSTPWVASADWDGGNPEEERRFPRPDLGHQVSRHDDCGHRHPISPL